MSWEVLCQSKINISTFAFCYSALKALAQGSQFMKHFHNAWGVSLRLERHLSHARLCSKAFPIHGSQDYPMGRITLLTPFQGWGNRSSRRRDIPTTITDSRWQPPSRASPMAAFSFFGVMFALHTHCTLNLKGNIFISLSYFFERWEVISCAPSFLICKMGIITDCIPL